MIASRCVSWLAAVVITDKFRNYRGQPKAGTCHKMLSVPFQGPAFRCDKIIVIVTLLEAIEGIPDKDYNVTFWGTTSFPIFARDYFMSENLRVAI